MSDLTMHQNQYVLMLADNALMRGQRMGEWLSHAPEMELDMAAGNMALDLIGQSKLFYEWLAARGGEARSSDEIAMARPEHEYVNVQLAEQPNIDWGHSMLRLYFMAVFTRLQYGGLAKFGDPDISAIAAKAVKEIDYHIRFSRGWVVTLGQATDESAGYMSAALERLWRFTGDLFIPSAAEMALVKDRQITDLAHIGEQWAKEVGAALLEAGLSAPSDIRMLTGGKQGAHTEHLGHLLSELQYMQRAYPGLNW